jgi:rhodanese-related sulfurtransferase
MSEPRTVDELLEAARTHLRRVNASEAARAARGDALLVDIRPAEQRDRDGTIPGALVIERNVLEWRLDPASAHRIPQSSTHDRVVIVVCDEGYASTFAALSLQQLGLRNATDLVGGFQAWKAAGLPTESR